jgi:hypothetical protein
VPVVASGAMLWAVPGLALGDRCPGLGRPPLRNGSIHVK